MPAKPNFALLRNPLTEAEIEERMFGLPNWDAKNEVLSRTFVFANFEQAWAFMSMAALQFERMNHHPNWNNSYGKVRIELTTHSANALTALDFEMACLFDRVAIPFLETK